MFDESFAVGVGLILGLAGFGVTVYPSLLPERVRRPVAAGCFIGAGALLVWLLWRVSPILAAAAIGLPLMFYGGRALLRRLRRKDAVAQVLTVQGAAHIHVAGQVLATGTVVSPWSADATEPAGLHELYPHTTGVLLWCRHKDGVPEGTYLCDVTFEDKTGTARDLTPSTDGRLDYIYPRDFHDAPSLPLRDGKYKVEWSRVVGIGREGIIEIEFERRRGKLLRPWDAGVE